MLWPLAPRTGGSPSRALAGVGWGDPRRAPAPWPASSGRGEAVPPCRCRHSHPAIHTGGNLNRGRTSGRGGQSTCSPPQYSSGPRPPPASRCLPLPAGKECDLNRQCGVLNPDTKKICTRLLTCKVAGCRGGGGEDTIILPRGFWGGSQQVFSYPPDPLPTVTRHRSTRFTNAARCRVGPRTLTCWWPS